MFAELSKETWELLAVLEAVVCVEMLFVWVVGSFTEIDVVRKFAV